ncbi:MAG: iron ABC transporter permease [bacterium]|nr:iron ABC transporter permease [bacterium]
MAARYKDQRLSQSASLGLFALAMFFFAFMVYPVLKVVVGAVSSEKGLTLSFFQSVFRNPLLRESIVNSFELSLTTTLVTLALSLPLSYALTRLNFAGKRWLSALVLVPMVMPPFVGAIGMKQVLARFGSVNLLLMELGVIDRPIGWLASGFGGVVVLQALHLYPIMYLNLCSALANIDPSLEDAARNLGAGGARRFRTVTLPLMMPGVFAGCSIVFIWAFTDLGTPLIFGYQNLVPIQIFNKISEGRVDPTGYALVVLVLVLTLLTFVLSKRLFSTGRYEMLTKGTVSGEGRRVGALRTAVLHLCIGFLLLAALLPHVSVVLRSVAGRWFMTVLPDEFTGEYFSRLMQHGLTASSIRNSVFYSSASAVIDVALGVGIAYMLARKKFAGRNLLDAMAMLPLALPGLVLAFGYVIAFSRSRLLDPFVNPVPLLIIAYSIRRLPFIVRAAYAGLQQVSPTFEEASYNLGAGWTYTLRRVTLPLISSNLIAGAVMCFAFAMLEVSASLVLALRQQFFPVTKTIYFLFNRIGDGPSMASALGVLGMALLVVCILVSAGLMGKKMGALFRM